MSDGRSDPELRYREGFEEGAWALYRALKDHLPPGNATHDWLTRSIEPWRLTAQQAASSGKPVTRLPPPPYKV